MQWFFLKALPVRQLLPEADFDPPKSTDLDIVVLYHKPVNKQLTGLWQ